MPTTVLTPPRVGDIVHYTPLDLPGCRAAIVTEIHIDAHLATLAVLHPSGMQFLQQIRQAELEHLWEQYEPGTWHVAHHQ